MGLFSKLFKGNDNADTIINKQSSATTTSSNVIDMSKSAENLNNVLIDMSKGGKIDMTKHMARVALAMDYSGSMSNLFVNGSIQDVITRLLPIALKFDDNGELESWFFSDNK